jgi:flagella basal body P-ring formation protein FlgA
MAALAADLPVATGPLPGLARVFHPPELRRMTALYGLRSAPQTDICVTRAMAPLDPQRLLDAMCQELPGAEIELVDFNRQPAPQGAVRFPRTGLHSGPVPTPAGSLWTGWVAYGEKGRFSIWARVRVSVTVERVAAVNSLPAGQTITEADVQLRRRAETPSSAQTGSVATSLDRVIGKWPRHTIRAGEVIRMDCLEDPKVVLRGERVKATVLSGAAQLQLDAVAEASGAAGETIFVRNPESGRRFPARVEAAGRVIVKADR